MAHWKGVEDETGLLESGGKETRLEGTERRCLSFGTQCLGISRARLLTAQHSLSAALPAPTLLSIHSTLPCSSSVEIKDASNGPTMNRNAYCTQRLRAPSSLESSGWAKILAFVCMWCLPELVFLWLSGVSSGFRTFAVLNSQCWTLSEGRDFFLVLLL